MKKARIVTRVKDKTGISKSKNRSGDLAELQQRFQQFAKKLKFLILAVQANHNAMLAYGKSRLDVAKAINSLSADTPLFPCAGDIGPLAPPADSSGNGSGDAASASTSTALANFHPTSYAAIHLQLHKKTKIYHDKYMEHVVNYAVEWERVLTNRISLHIKQANKLRVDLDHYNSKVESLRQDANKTMSKGKSVPEKDVDKLRRNEQKLLTSRQDYDKFVSDLCGYMEEVMDRGWKDLHPMLVKLSQFDATLSTEEANCCKAMYGVTEKLKEMSTRHVNVKAGGRLKELETWSLSSVVQASGEAAGSLTIEGSGSGDGDLPQSVNPETLQVGGGGLFGNLGSSRSIQDYSSTGNFDDSSSYDNVRNSSLTITTTSGADNSTNNYYGGSQMSINRTESGVLSNRSRTNTGDSGTSFHWSGSGTPALTPAAAPSSLGLPPVHRGSTSSFQSQPSNPDLSGTSNMLAVARAAAPPPTLDDIFGGGGGGAPAPPPAGFPPPVPPPPSMPPPPPPQAQFAGLSMYDNSGGGFGFVSPSNQSTGTATTNPFDDGGASFYGAQTGNNMMSPMSAGGGGGMPSMQSSMNNNYQQPQQQQQQQQQPGNYNMGYGAGNYQHTNSMGSMRDSTNGSNPFD